MNLKFAVLVGAVEWTNPHMRIYVDVKEPNGTVTTFGIKYGF